MKRTWEKVIAWLANIIVVFFAGFLAVLSFGGMLPGILANQEVKAQLEESIRQAAIDNPAVATRNITTDDLIVLIETGVKGYAVFFIVLAVVAIIASLLMRKRILSGILFLLLAVAVTLATLAVGWFVGLAYLIVAVMLFVRREPKNPDNKDPFDPENPENRVEEIKYV